MNNNLTKGHLQLLKEQYETACNQYVFVLLNLWGFDSHYGYWVGGSAGSTYCYGDDLFFDMDDIIFIVENNVSEKAYRQYLDYCAKCSEYSFNIPNFPSYYKGCPIVPKETFDKLDGLKKNLADAIEEEKSKTNSNGKY